MEPVSERALRREGKNKARVPGDVDRLAVDRDDRAVAQFRENFPLVAYAVVAVGVGGDLEYSQLIVGVAHEERHSGRSTPETLDDAKASDDVPGHRGQRLDLFRLVHGVGRCDLLL